MPRRPREPITIRPRSESRTDPQAQLEAIGDPGVSLSQEQLLVTTRRVLEGNGPVLKASCLTSKRWAWNYHSASRATDPEGSARKGFAFVAPLDDDGHLDAHSWPDERRRCLVRRFWDGEPDSIGRLVHRRGGSGSATWHFVYSNAGKKAQESGYRLEHHRLVPGEYMRIREDNCEMNTFKVADVRKVCCR